MPPKKTTKTAHVLNLLTAGDGEGSQTPESADSSGSDVLASVKFENSQPAKRGSGSESANGKSGAVSETIRGELERVFKAESSTAGDTLAVKAISGKTPISRNAESGNNKMDEPITSVPNEQDYVTVNIIEDIVKSRAGDFIKKLGVCSCHKCTSDVIAIALNSLPPKYTVTHKGMLFAKISSYENQHSADISQALTKACMMVLESPKH